MNLLLHLCNVLLVYWLLVRFLRDLKLAFFIAAIWAVHPLLTEAVTNIAGRADLLAALAVLSGTVMYIKSTEAAAWKRIAWLAGLFFVTALGAFSKESAVCIVAVLAAYEIFRWKTPGRLKPFLVGCLVTMAPVALMLSRRSAVLAASLPAELPFVDNPIAGADFWTGRLTAVKVIAHYLWLLAWPAKLSADYSWPQIPLARGSMEDWAAWIVVLAVAAGLAFLGRYSRAASFFAVFAVVTFLPVSNLLFSTGTIMAERLMYLPSVGLIACAVISITTAAQKTRIWQFMPAIFCIAIVACAARTWLRNLDWRDDLTIATASLEASPNSFKLHRERASSLFESDPAHANIAEVVEEADKSVQLLESLPNELNNREAWRLAGGYHLVKGDLRRSATGQSRPAGETAPEISGDYRKALELLLRAAAIDRSYRAAYGRKVESARARNPAVPAAPAPDSDLYQFLAACYIRLGKTAEALGATRRALALHPRMPGAYQQIAYTFSAFNRSDDAAIALIEGMILTSDAALEKDLLNLYSDAAFANTCVFVRNTDRREIDRSCIRVREHFCAASADVIKGRIEDGERDLARQLDARFSREYGCPANSPF